MTSARNESAASTAGRLPVDSLPVMQAGLPFPMLAGVRVVDMTTSVAGPYATMLLSDFGAEVIKIERPEGDDARQWGPPFLNGQALWFAAMNRNKKSVVLDLRREDGMEALRQLVATADIFITNQPPDVQRKLRLDHDTLAEGRDDLIGVSITGFGMTGARAEYTCYDLIAEGYSGIMDLTGQQGGAAQKIGAPAADMLAGQDAAMAIMAALYERQRTGKGRRIDVSLVDSMTRFLACRISSYLGSGEVPTRSGGTDSVIAIYQPFDTADLPITLGLGSNPVWTRFWAAMGDPEYGARPEFASNADRRLCRFAIVEHIQSLLLARTQAEWLALFAQGRVPAGPINSVDQVAADPELQARSLIFALEGEDGRLMPQIGLGIHIDGAPSIPASGPPTLGQHTAEIMATLESPAAA
jgi:crotonobetainyl-CoA:carnitine CoA-transferase CaiB-like acyl-CoA transferase